MSDFAPQEIYLENPDEAARIKVLNNAAQEISQQAQLMKNDKDVIGFIFVVVREKKKEETDPEGTARLEFTNMVGGHPAAIARGLMGIAGEVQGRLIKDMEKEQGNG